MASPRPSCNSCRNRRKFATPYSQIFLWIDLDRGVSVQQQFLQPQGDYRLAKYSAFSDQR